MNELTSMIWFRGYFRTSAQRYLIEPLSSDDEGDHAVTTFNEKNFTPAVCGVTNTSWSDDYEPPTSRSRSRSGVTQLVLSSLPEFLQVMTSETF